MVFNRRVRALLAVSALLASAPPSFAADTWEPIDAADLAAKESTAQPGADSEVLFFRCVLEDDTEGVFFRYHVRGKIFTPRGVEDAGKLHIDRDDDSKLWRLRARVVKPDGTSIELKKSDFLESVVAKLGNARMRRTAFAFPGLAPGDIVEYRWSIQSDGGVPIGEYFCQQSVPVREYSMEIAAHFDRLNAGWFNVPGMESKKLSSSRLKLVGRNLEAFVEEPQMPPELDCRGWIRLSYLGSEGDAVKAWQEFSKRRAEAFESAIRPNDAIRKKSAELAAGAASPAEVVRRLDEFCREKILNLTWSDTPEARDARQKKLKQNRPFQTPRETLELGRGSALEIDYLFASLLQAAGRDPHLAANAPTHRILNTRIVQGWAYTTETHVVLMEDGRWKFYSPGDRFVPFGMCNSYDEGAMAFVFDKKKSVVCAVPPSPADLSRVHRKAKLTLDADGTLHGEIDSTFTGHEATRQQFGAWRESQEETDQELIERLQRRLSGAEVSGIRWGNLRQQAGPVTTHYEVNMPGYAEVAGQRLVFVPNYFQRGRKPLFTAPERKHNVMWSHAWTEADEIEIALPPELEIEQATAPPSLPDSSGLVESRYEVAYSKRRHAILYRRDFVFTGKLGLMFRPDNYGPIKTVFELLNQSDQHSIVLRRKSGPPAESSSPTAPPAHGTAEAARKDPS